MHDEPTPPLPPQRLPWRHRSQDWPPHQAWEVLAFTLLTGSIGLLALLLNLAWRVLAWHG